MHHHSTDRATLQAIAQRYQLSESAVATLLAALQQGNGQAAQFNHPELGGMGQWMSGGMLMIGDMFNHALKARIDAACRELAALLAHSSVPPTATTFGTSQPAWWPPEFGSPTSSGRQNSNAYAYFASLRRLAILAQNRVTIYDTLDYQISGIAQQQSSSATITFTSQKGIIALNDLLKLSDYPLA